MRSATSDLRARAFLLVFALANVGGVIAYLPLLTLLLPVKIEGLSGDARIGVFTACVTAGAVAASLSNILFGWLSDRSVRRGRGRRGWIVIGVLLTGASYAAVDAAATPATLVIAIVAFQCAVNAILAPMMAIMAEEIPDAQKGVAGGLLSLGSPAASAFSAMLMGGALLSDTMRFAAVPLATAACLLPLLAIRLRVSPEGEADAPDQHRADASRRDLLTAGLSRLLVQVAGVVTQAYLLYYFESIVVDDRTDLPVRIGHLLTIAFVAPLPIALVLGRLSDRARRRKPFLLLSSGLAAAGLLGMAVAPGWSTGAVAFAVYATGASIFVALHSAFAMQLLPSAEHRGRDLGLLNLANTLPSLLGPPLTWMLATPSNFSPVMALLAVLTVCGGVGMLGVRAWR